MIKIVLVCKSLCKYFNHIFTDLEDKKWLPILGPKLKIPAIIVYSLRDNIFHLQVNSSVKLSFFLQHLLKKRRYYEINGSLSEQILWHCFRVLLTIKKNDKKESVRHRIGSRQVFFWKYAKTFFKREIVSIWHLSKRRVMLRILIKVQNSVETIWLTLNCKPYIFLKYISAELCSCVISSTTLWFLLKVPYFSVLFQY